MSLRGRMTEFMRIGIFSDNFYPEMSGITDSIITLAKNLSNLGYEVVFFAPKYESKNFLDIGAEAKEIDLGARVKVIRFGSWAYKTSTGQGRLVLPTLWRWLKIKREKLDIIHTQDFFGVGLEALITAKLLRIPLVGTNHTPITEFLNYGPSKSKIIKNLSRHFVSWYYNQCRLVTAPSQCILDEMKKFGLRQPSQVVSNPIEIKNYYPLTVEDKIKLKKEFNLSDFTVLCSGRLAEEKHIDIVIRAIESVKRDFPKISLAITGGGTAEQSLRRLTADLKLENNIKFFGFVEPDRLIKIYQASDVYIIASTAETQSISLMKSMAVGLPVIGVNAWALPEYINDDNGFIVEPGDYRAMAEKIKILYQNQDLRNKLGQGGIETVKNFSEEKIAKHWETIYKSITKAKE